jgi:hypothetical protein
MKTTVDIPDTLLDEARKLAARERTTLRMLIVEGLRRIGIERRRSGTFKLRDASFGGDGMHPDVVGASWARIRGLAYGNGDG